MTRTSSGRRIGVTGGRNYEDVGAIEGALKYLEEGDIVVHGGARGADTLFARTAEQHGYQTEPHLADWNKHGKAAGPIRNQEILDSGLHALIVFPGGRGTAHMTSICQRAGVEIWKVHNETDIGN